MSRRKVRRIMVSCRAPEKLKPTIRGSLWEMAEGKIRLSELDITNSVDLKAFDGSQMRERIAKA